MAIIKQLQFHMACSFQIEEEEVKAQWLKRVTCANIDVPFFKNIALLSNWAWIPLAIPQNITSSMEEN